MGQCALLAFFRQWFRFIPNVNRAQALRPDVIDAEAHAIRLVLLPEDYLTRLQKERILLVVSGANSNEYFVAVHAEILRMLGVHAEDAEKSAVDHHHAGISENETAFLDFSVKLAVDPSGFGPRDLIRVRSH